MKHKKLLIFFPNCEQGGTERVISILSKYFNDDYELTLVTLCKNDLKYEYVSNRNIVIENNFINKYEFKNKINRYVSWIKSTNSILEEIKPDIVLTFGEIPNFLVLLLKIFKKSKSKVIINIRNSESLFLEKAQFGSLIKLSMKYMYNKADLILTNSNGNKRDLIDHIYVRKNIEVVYNPVSIVNNLEKDEREKKRIINIGRLDKQKAQHYLLESFAKVKEQVEDVELLIIGKGEREEELKALTKQLKIENDVKFLGWQDNPFYWLQNSDVFVLTSLWEGMPNVVIESMACKCPVISFDCPSGPNEIINKPNENGILVEVGDVDKLTKDIVKVLSDDEYRQELSKSAYIRALDFEQSKIYSKFREKIEECLNYE
ncbi:glycosyltransferase [Arcobacter sp. FWKO B]|uniref:glycosyltransferase n=1 Tax=Arcobacter sp. FWKO B TaxID=2593672 RepID=UPI001907DA8D|nr:glycosyltransferase [Arcobacter sp. FWKO B]